MGTTTLEQRVERAADAALTERRYVSVVDLLIGMRWLEPVHVDMWRHGRLDHLVAMMGVNPDKLASALELFRAWAQRHRLTPSETDYVARTPDRRPLRFTAAGEPEIERAYRTHWVAPDMTAAQRERQSRQPDLVVISPLTNWTCTECCGTGDLLIMQGDGPVCLRCTGLDQLVFLPAGNATLTRRARKASGHSAIVVRFSRSRKRYERQGLLVEPDAIPDTDNHSG